MGFLELSCSDAKNNTAGHREAQGTQAWMPPEGGGGGANAVAPYRAKARIQASFRQIGVDGRESMPSVGQMAACIVSGMTHMSIRHDAVPERLSSRPGAGAPGGPCRGGRRWIPGRMRAGMPELAVAAP